MGDAETDTTTVDTYPPYETRSGGSSGGQRYKVIAGGQTVTVTCSPSANVTGTGDQVNASVVYDDGVYPVIIVPGGATEDSDGSWNILVGQHCSTGLSGIFPGWTSNYQWSVSGDTFQTWSADTPAVGGNDYNPDASYYVDGPGPLTGESAGWYWNDLMPSGASKAETVSCTATVTPPAGEGSAFTVSATQQVTVYRPKWTCTGTGGTLLVSIPTTSAGYSVASGDYWLWAGPSSGSGLSSGMVWKATVNSPMSALFADGSIVIAQLIIPDYGYSQAPNVLSVTNFAWSLNGQEVLDTNYPYPWTDGPANYFGGDSPGIDLVGDYAVAAHLGPQFEDYLMYFAPGSVQPVPIAHFVWSTNGSVAIPNSGNWGDYGTASAGTVTPGSTTSFLSSNSFPMWTGNWTDGHWVSP